MTSQPEQTQPEPAGIGLATSDRHPKQLGRIVLAWSAIILFVIGAGIATNWQDNRALGGKVDRSIARSHRIDLAVDSVRVPVCAVMAASLSRPTTGYTAQQYQARRVYLAAYGPGTADHPGLNCPDRLPDVGR